MTLLLAFVAGAGVLALEIVAVRWLAPAFGFTLGTWSILISVTLLAGSVGAWLGGALGRRIEAGPPLLVAAAGTAVAALAAPGLTGALLALPILAGATVAALGLLLVPVAALATVVPILARRAGGASVGRLLAASTAGSLAGTLLPALVLLPALGVRRTTLGLAAVLALAAVVALRRVRDRIATALAATAALTGAFLVPPAHGADIRETPYGTLSVIETPGGLAILVNGINQGAVSSLAAGPDALLRHRQHLGLLPWMRPAARTAICVGLGGGLVPRALEAHGIRTETIEIDPVLVEVARERLGFDGPVVVGDGRAVLRRAGRRVDLIVLDAFLGEAAPAHLLTREAFEEARARLTPGGVLAVHRIGRPDDPATAAVARTLDAVFETVLCVRAGAGEPLEDLVLFASDGPLVVPPHPELAALGWLGNEVFAPRVVDAPLLTDDLRCLDLLADPLARELRRASRAGRR